MDCWNDSWLDQELFSLPCVYTHSDPLSASHPVDTWDSLSRAKGIELTTYLHLILRLTMHHATPTLSYIT